MRYLKDFATFINESMGPVRATDFDVKLSQATDIVLSYLNKHSGKDFKKYPFQVTSTIDGRDVIGFMLYSNKDNSAVRVSAPGVPGGLIGSLEYYSDFATEVADFSMSSQKFPIVQLLGEFVLLMTDKRYLDEVNESIEYITEAEKTLTSAEVAQIKKMLGEGMSGREIARIVKVPRSVIYSFKNGVPTPEKKSAKEEVNEATLQDKVKYLNEVLEDIYEITRRVAAGAFNSLFISGKAGTGKTFNVEKALKDEGLTAEKDYTIMSGAVSVIEMYKKFFQYNDKVLVFDDCDAVFRDENGRNILKAALDTKKVRKISYLKKIKELYDPKEYEDDPDAELEAVEDGMVPSYFEFTGRVIFISNLEKDKADPDGAIRSRSILIDVSPDDATLMERMRLLLPELEPRDLPLNEKEEIFEFMKSSKSVSMRTFVKAAGFKMAGLREWKRMAERYL
ncbi:hypothetical protein EBU94_02565 [bacterium]|nr:hypothetical protein [bacterium]